MTVAVIAASVALGVSVAVLVVKRARARANRRFEALLRQVDESLGAVAQAFRAAADRSPVERGAGDLSTPKVEDLLEQIVAGGSAARAFKHVAEHMVPALAQAGASLEPDPGSPYGYEAELERTVSKARQSGRPLALVLLDLGAPGAAEDERLPAELAALLARVTRASDTVCRRRFHELGVLLPETNADGARRFHGRVRDEMTRAEFGQMDRATFATGIVEWQPNETSASFDARARAAADRAALGSLEFVGENSRAPHGQRPVL